jgi:peroxiredoxin Q/BCP
MPISNQIAAPDFELAIKPVSCTAYLDYQGKPVLLYFYPKEDTSGCTTEACNFRDDYSRV